MDKQYWTDKWEKNDTAFHLNAVNPLLKEYWPKLNVEKNASILVPLCGKSLDLKWLNECGHRVIGVELSEIACKAFFIENNLPFDIQKRENFTCFYHHQIELYCGDFFELSKNILPMINAVYDRAALIAFPIEMKKQYTNHLFQLMENHSQILLIVYESPDSVNGPPFSVSFNDVKQLYGKHFQISELARNAVLEIPKHLKDKGFIELDEVVYHIK
jgi:thiopurine S-methyltransferase